MVRTFYTMLEELAQEQTSNPALISPAGALTFQDLLEQADQLAGGLSDLPIQQGDRVCLLAHNAVETFLLLGACARIGAILFPVNWRLSAQEIQAVLALADPTMLVVDGANFSTIEGVVVEEIPHRYVFGFEAPEGWHSLTNLMTATPGTPPEIHAEDAFVLLSTAAVEGLPRAATLSHRNLLTANELLIDQLGLNPDDRHLSALPLFHVTGLGLSLATLQAGAANVIQEHFDPVEAVNLMDLHQVSLLASFPPVLTALIEAREAAGARWESLRYVLGLDAPETIQRLLATSQAAFWTGYGQSETTGVVTLIDVRQKPGAVGKPLPGIELRCFDEEGNEVSVNEPGEIVVRGPLVFLGYWDDNDATLYVSRHGWHHTGDLGRLDEEGYLYYMGRKPEKDLIKSGGENIYPAEVEFAISSLPQVQAVCVIGVPDETWGESVKAVIEVKQGEALTEGQVIEAVTSRIASFKKPRRIEFVDSLPRTPEGQIDRVATQASFGS